ncbi:type II secretion system protein GspL [Methylibium sp.]|uniref:type II secretion system protein GspL n=1 Tax=Methylibium sp. TaxID=2067992 RepID=UPI003D11329F
MTTLVVSFPPRPRLRAGATAPAPRVAGNFAYAFSNDSLDVIREGQAAPALLPKADQVVAVLAATDVSWHRIVCPKAPPARLGVALAGVLEEALLEDTAQLHFALAPGAKGGDLVWVAATDRAWLAGEIAMLEGAGLRVDRVVPAAWPDEPASGHFAETHDGGDAGVGGLGLMLTWAHADGVACWPLQGGLARALLPQPLPADARFTATPAVAAPAERWLGSTVRVQSPAEHALQAARSLWNLRQFGLAPRHRGLNALREAGRRFRSSAWQPVRLGLTGLVAVQLIGLNVAAWQQRNALEAKRVAMTDLLHTTYPQVRAVLDAPVQMQKETDALRVAAGRPGEADFESALQAAASAWPAQQPVQMLGYENGLLTLATPGWSDVQIQSFRDALSSSGWQVEAVDERVSLRRVSAPGGRRT